MIFTLSDLSHTAILFFSRTPKAEAQAKCIVPSWQKNNRLTLRLINNTLQLIKKSGLPYYRYDESKQIYATFGSNLRLAFEELFKQGYQRVIAIGNDSPGLRLSHIHRAVVHLDSHELVVGETFSGGIYLLGLCPKAFADIDFEHLPWQTPSLADSLAQQCARLKIRIKFLEPTFELNKYAVIKTSWRIPYKSLLNDILSLILTLFTPIAPIQPLTPCSTKVQVIPFRGPPFAHPS